MDDGMGFEGSKPTAAVWVALDAPFLVVRRVFSLGRVPSRASV